MGRENSWASCGPAAADQSLPQLFGGVNLVLFGRECTSVFCVVRSFSFQFICHDLPSDPDNTISDPWDQSKAWDAEQGKVMFLWFPGIRFFSCKAKSSCTLSSCVQHSCLICVAGFFVGQLSTHKNKLGPLCEEGGRTRLSVYFR